MPKASALPEIPSRHPNQPCRDFCFLGTQPLDLGRHFALARLRRKDVQTFLIRWRRFRAAAAFCGIEAQSQGQDRNVVPNCRHTRGWA